MRTKMRYRLRWRMKHSSVNRTVASESLVDLAIVYSGLVTRQVQMETLKLEVWDQASVRQYKSIPFPTNWEEIIEQHTEKQSTRCLPVVSDETFEVKSDETRIPATGS